MPLDDPVSHGGLARPGDSMSLLQDLVEHPVDDDYYTVASRPATERRGRGDTKWITVGVLATFALLVSVAALQTRLDEPAAQTERTALIGQIDTQKKEIRSKQQQVTDLRSQVSALRAESPQQGGRLEFHNLQITTGTVPVEGPGVRIVVDNADEDQGWVMDQDLQLLVNGLWLAGAEAVSINGSRLTTLSSIRTAGEAITVNYKSLTRPYVVSAIGDPRTLQARFIETRAGQTWSNLHSNFGLRFDMEIDRDLSLPAAPGKRARAHYAEPMEATP